MKKSLKARILAVTLIGMISLNSGVYNGLKTEPAVISAAQTIEELEAMKSDNKQKIAELQAEIDSAQKEYDSIVKDENAKIQYQKALNDKIELQNLNVEYVMNQINQIDKEIEENQARLSELETQITEKNNDINKSISLFKQRLRASYMSGNDTLAAVFTGSADFYDMLAKMELVSKVAEHDDDLIKTLNVQLKELDELNAAHSARQADLDNSLESANERKAEFAAVIDELSKDYKYTQSQIDALNEDKQDITVSIEEKQAVIAAEEQEYEKILADIAVVQEEIRKKAEEEAKKKAEEEARKKAEEAKKKAEEEEAKKKAEEEAKKRQQELQQAAIAQQQTVSQNTTSVTETPSQETPSQAVTETPSEPETPASETPSYSSGFAWPVPGYYGITSYFGYRDFDSSYHKGLDLSSGGIAGAAIVAADDGVVASVSNSCTHNYSKYSSCGCGGGYGNYLTIVHNDGVYTTLYAHCQSVIVSVGQSVSKGQTIAYVGTTGYSTGNHLHFEVTENGNRVDPLSFY